MTFEEFQAEDQYDAYYDWNKLAAYKECGMFPEEYHQFFPDVCPHCGSDIIIKINFKLSMCCNPKCRCKAGYKLAEFFSRFGVKGMGAKSCQKVYDTMVKKNNMLLEAGEPPILQSSSALATLLVPWNSYPLSLQDAVLGEDFFRASVQVRSASMTFAEMIGYLGIKDLGVSKAKTLFADINSIDDFTQKINDAGGLESFCEAHGVHSRITMSELVWAFDDLAVAAVIFQSSIRNVGLKNVRLCMTGSIRCNGRAITKKQYIADLNAMCVDVNGVQLFDFDLTSGAVNDPFILYSNESRSSKFVKGLQRGTVTDEFGTHKVLMTADEFYEKMKEVMNQWNQTLQNGTIVNPLDLMKACWTQTNSTCTDSVPETPSEISSEICSVQAF